MFNAVLMEKCHGEAIDHNDDRPLVSLSPYPKFTLQKRLQTGVKETVSTQPRAPQANSGNLNNFIHLPTHEFLEGRIRKAHEQDEGACSSQDDAAPETQEIPAAPPQSIVEVDPQLVQAANRCLVKRDGLKRPHMPLNQRLHVLKHSFPAMDVFKSHVESMEAEIVRARQADVGDRIIQFNQTQGIYSQRLETKLSAIATAGIKQAQRRIAAYRGFKEAEAATLLRRFQKDARLKQREHMRDTAAAIADVKDYLRGFANAFAKYVAVASRTQVFLELAEYASSKRLHRLKLDKSAMRIQRFVRYHMFRGKLMHQTRMIVAIRKIFWRPMLKILHKRRIHGTAVIKDSLIVMQSTGKVLQAIRKFKSNVLACQRVVRVFNNITVARTLLLFMQIAIADRKRVAALKQIWNKKMQEVQAVMASAGRTTRVNRERIMMQQRMRIDRILDSMPEGTQNAKPIDQTVLLELAREKLAIMRLAYRQRVFEFHSQTQQSKNFSSLREIILANFPQILTIPSLVAKEQWLFHDTKTKAPAMHMILKPSELEEILNRGVYRMKLKSEAADAVKFPMKAAVPMEKSSSPVSLSSPSRGYQPSPGVDRYRLPPLSSFKTKRGVVKERTPYEFGFVAHATKFLLHEFELDKKI